LLNYVLQYDVGSLVSLGLSMRARAVEALGRRVDGTDGVALALAGRAW